jgi:hypothetical protein
MSSNSCDTMEICLVVELMSSLQKKKKKCVYMCNDPKLING